MNKSRWNLLYIFFWI